MKENFHSQIDQAQSQLSQKLGPQATPQIDQQVDSFQNFVQQLQYVNSTQKSEALKTVKDDLKQILSTKEIQSLRDKLVEDINDFRKTLGQKEIKGLTENFTQGKKSLAEKSQTLAKFQDKFLKIAISPAEKSKLQSIKTIRIALEQVAQVKSSTISQLSPTAQRHIANSTEELNIELSQITQTQNTDNPLTSANQLATLSKKITKQSQDITHTIDYAKAEKQLHQSEQKSNLTLKEQLTKITKIQNPTERAKAYLSLSNSMQATHRLQIQKYDQLYRTHSSSPAVRRMIEQSLLRIRESYKDLEKLKNKQKYLNLLTKFLKKYDKYFEPKVVNGQLIITQKSDSEISQTDLKNKSPKERSQFLLKLKLSFYRTVGKEMTASLNNINETCAPLPGRHFHQGADFLKQGKTQSAKAALLKYINELPKADHPREKQTLDSAKQMLKQIAFQEVAQVNMMYDKLNMTTYAYSEVEHIPKLGKIGATLRMEINTAQKILAQMNKLIDSGKALTLKDAEKQILSQDDKWGDKDTLKQYKKLKNTISDLIPLYQEIAKIEDPEAKRLHCQKIAQKLQSKGLYYLAKIFYEQYFAPTFEKVRKQQKLKTKSELKDLILKDPSQKAHIEKYIKQMKSNPKYKHVTPEQIKQALVKKMVEDRYVKQLTLATHKHFQEGAGKNTPLAKEWNDFDKGYLQLDRSFYEIWKFTHEEWDRFTRTLPFEAIALVITFGASMAVGKTVTQIGTNLTRTALLRQTANQVFKKVMERELSKGIAKEAAKITAKKAQQAALKKWAGKSAKFLLERGTKMQAGFGFNAAGKTLGFLAENAAFVSIGEMISRGNTGQTSLKSWSDWAKAYGHSVATLGLLKATGGLYGKALEKTIKTQPGLLTKAGLSATQLLTLDGATMTANTYFWDVLVSGKKIPDNEWANIVRQNLVMGAIARTTHAKLNLNKPLSKKVVEQAHQGIQEAYLAQIAKAKQESLNQQKAQSQTIQNPQSKPKNPSQNQPSPTPPTPTTNQSIPHPSSKPQNNLTASEATQNQSPHQRINPSQKPIIQSPSRPRRKPKPTPPDITTPEGFQKALSDVGITNKKFIEALSKANETTQADKFKLIELGKHLPKEQFRYAMDLAKARAEKVMEKYILKAEKLMQSQPDITPAQLKKALEAKYNDPEFSSLKLSDHQKTLLNKFIENFKTKRQELHQYALETAESLGIKIPEGQNPIDLLASNTTMKKAFLENLGIHPIYFDTPETLAAFKITVRNGFIVEVFVKDKRSYIDNVDANSAGCVMGFFHEKAANPKLANRLKLLNNKILFINGGAKQREVDLIIRPHEIQHVLYQSLYPKKIAKPNQYETINLHEATKLILDEYGAYAKGNAYRYDTSALLSAFQGSLAHFRNNPKLTKKIQEINDILIQLEARGYNAKKLYTLFSTSHNLTTAKLKLQLKLKSLQEKNGKNFDQDDLQDIIDFEVTSFEQVQSILNIANKNGWQLQSSTKLENTIKAQAQRESNNFHELTVFYKKFLEFNTSFQKNTGQDLLHLMVEPFRQYHANYLNQLRIQDPSVFKSTVSNDKPAEQIAIYRQAISTLNEHSYYLNLCHEIGFKINHEFIKKAYQETDQVKRIHMFFNESARIETAATKEMLSTVQKIAELDPSMNTKDLEDYYKDLAKQQGVANGLNQALSDYAMMKMHSK